MVKFTGQLDGIIRHIPSHRAGRGGVSFLQQRKGSPHNQDGASAPKTYGTTSSGITCYNCGKDAHYANKCPSKQREQHRQRTKGRKGVISTQLTNFVNSS